MIGDEHRQTINHQCADVRRLGVENEDPISTLDDEGAPRELIIQRLAPYYLNVAQREAAPFPILREVLLEDGLVAEFL